jgi:hypothetical protein
MALTMPTVIRAATQRNTPLGSAMNEIRTWLDREKIEPVEFKTVVGRAGFGFEISFKSEDEAVRFQERFASLIA